MIIRSRPIYFYFHLLVLFTLLLIPGISTINAAVLAEDRTDLLYHSYDGGNITINGPALLIRKGFAEDFSATAHYYEDNISSASIDVESYASPYEEFRAEFGATMDYLYRDTILNISFTNSSENDYEANTLGLSMSHEMFYGLTTLNLGYSRGADTVGKSTDPTFNQEVDRARYHFGVSQVITKKLLLTVDLESISAVGFLNNPYRAVRINGAFNQPERYPRTRSGLAVATRGVYYLGNDSTLMLGYRYYTDNWAIDSHTLEARYNHFYSSKLLAEYSVRYYTQVQASFYNDDFDQPYFYMARDKEMSTFSSYSLGYKLSYKIFESNSFFKRGDINLSYNFFQYNYDNFTHYATGDLYSYNANVITLFYSTRY
ncbi:MAG: DUF3570 domain-containing protein [Thiohalomonadales bacterium]